MNRQTLTLIAIFIITAFSIIIILYPGHHPNLICSYNIFHQLTAKLKIGPRGQTAAQPAEVEPRREEGELFKRLRMEEMTVQLWRKRSRATPKHAKVIFRITTMTCFAHSLMPTCRQMRSLIFANGLTGLLVTSFATHRESQTRREKRCPRGRTENADIWTKVCRLP